jgi:hypothetical protein
MELPPLKATVEFEDVPRAKVQNAEPTNLAVPNITQDQNNDPEPQSGEGILTTLSEKN